MPAFKQGDLVVYRVGTGANALVNTGNAVFLDEYTPTGTLVQSVQLPTADAAGGVHALIASGTGASEGLLTLSADGHYLVLAGYDAAPGGSVSLPGSASTAIGRTVASVDANGTINTSTVLSDYASANNPRGVASLDGQEFWVDGGAGGIRYATLGATTSTQLSTTVTNLRAAEIYAGQLYVSDASGTAVRLGTVGTGTPTTSGQTITNLPGLPTSTGSPYAFVFADLSTSVAGNDTLYVADDGATGGGILKYGLVNGSWTAEGSITAAGVRGLTGSVVNGQMVLYGTTGGSGASGGGSLYSFTDSTGYGQSVSGTAATIATATTNEAFRGIAFAPIAVAAPTIYVSSGAVSHAEGNGGTTSYTFTLTRDSGTSDATVSYSVSGSGANPADATDFGGTLPRGTATFSGSSLTTTVTITVTGDTTPEPDEQFTVTLSSPSSGYVLGSPASQTGTIVDDDTSTDTTPPTLSAASPANGAADVAIGANVVLTFSEAVKAGTGNIVLHPEDGSANVTIAVGDTSQVTFSGSQVTINPTADLRPGVQYAVVVASGVITDAAGNGFAGVAQESLDFTTSTAIPAGSSATTFTIQDAGTFTLAAGATRTQTAGVAVQVASAGGPVTVDVEGTLTDTASGQRAINVANTAILGTIAVGANGSVQSLNADAIRSQSVNGTINLNNQGQIVAGVTAFTPGVGGTNPGTGYAVNFNAALGASGATAGDYTSGGTLTNGSAGNTAALVRADNGDAIRLGSHETLVNYGTINGNGQINDSSDNNAQATNGNTSTATTYDISRGVRINQAGATAVDIENHGTITGAQHGVDTGVTDATNIVVNNAAGASIIGRSGSGVGSDTTGASAATVIVTNAGLIEGDAHPQYDRAGYATTDADGDGVDIDGGATINNLAGGRILATGASGYDSNGRANQSEGISIGGGTIVNAGTIQGAGAGIVVNNDANPNGSRSGVAATTITNDATGTITGQAGYAIRLENKTGTAADDDSIVNYGTITGNGTVPTGTVLLENGSADAGTVGTLNGVSYTAAADAGSARFIQGDGAAIQMGEGNDTLADYGTITGTSGNGKSGLAISLEGGNDTLTLHTGSTVSGGIDGGAGSDTIVLALDDRPATGGGDAGNNGGVTTGTLAQVSNVETLDVQGGTWTIADAQGYGAGVVLESGATLVLGTGAQLTGSIADAGHLTVTTTGAITLADPISGAGLVENAGTGTLTLANAGSSYSGGTLLTAGTLDVAVAGAAGTGAIAFGSGAATLHVEAAAISGGSFANAITGFAADGDVIDAAGIGLATASYNAATGVLTLTGTSTESFQIGTGYGSYAFATAADGASGTGAGTAVTLVSTAPAALSIGDTSVTEGDSGTTTMVFTVSSSVAAPSGGISFHVNTGDGTATVADGDYVALNDYVATIAPGQTSTTVAVSVNGDTRYEANETLTATISQPSGSATIATAQGTGTIVNDDAAPTLSIGDARVAEGDSGQATLTFTVTASAPAPTGGITFGIATADGTASSGSDYVAHSATGTIAAGQTSATFTVLVNGDTTFERDETVLVNLSSPTNATIAHGQGVGTIENDDAPPATQQIFSTDFASFTAAGFAPGGVSGGLDSTVWRVVGLSDNTNPAYGFTGPAGGDFGRGVINGSADPVSAGVYSPSADHALIVQPTGAELDANGTIEARIQNTSGATATSFDVAFDWAYRNSGARADNLQLAYSTDGTNFTPVSAAAFTTPATADATVAGTFTDSHEAVSITGTVADGGYLYLRWIHASSTGGGSRDEVGIDNVGVTAHLSTTPTASVGDISVTEGNSGTTNAVFTITRSNGAGSASVDYATADGTAVSGSDYVAQRGTVTFAPGETSKTVTVLVDGDTQHEANETFTLNLSNATGFQVPQTSATATIVNDDTGPVAIYDIQGLGHRSPFTGQSVSTSGVVTAVKSNGFFLQDPTGDGNIGTSDAIFVVTSGAPTVSVGNAVSLTGTVTEYATAANYLSLTELTSPSAITVTAATAALPAAVVIATDGVDGHRAPPTSVIDDDNFHSYDPTTDGIDFYESLEGMRVTIRQPLVVANTDANGQTFVVASDGVGATGLNDRSGMTISSGDNNPETLKIYEGSSAAGAHSQGDVLNDVTGTLTYFGGRYEVDPTSTVTVATDNPPLARETTTLVGDANHLSYASFNIENFSPRDQDYTAPETAASKVQSLAAEVITALHSPNVIGLQEVQDNDGEGTGTDLSGAQNVQRLIDAIAAAGGPTYRYLEIAPTATNVSGGAPDGNIRNGFLYDPTKVSYVDGSLHVLTDAAFNGTRKPLVADFTFNGQTFTAIDQHSTSRGGSDPLFGTDQPPVAAGDAARTAQASAIKSYVDSVLAKDPGHQFVVNGDFNGFPYENALQALAAGGTLDNLYDKLPVQERYSYYFDGYYQAFDNIIVSHALSANTTFDIVHYNAGFTDGVSVTDHDQAIAEIGLARSTGTATAVADGYATTAAAILHGTVLANDTGGGATLSVAAVNGDATQVGTVDHLASGASLTLLSDGTFSYDTDGAFSYLAAGATATDQFSYTLASGSTALATVTVTGVATPAPDSSGHLDGTSGNDTFGGTTGADYFDLSAGGTDTVSGGAGADAFYMGAALTAGDHINGGSGDDQVGLLGDYTGANAIVLSATTLTNVETLAVLPGGSTPHSYDITSSDATVAAGQTFTVFGGNLAAGENLSFNGSAETDGSFLFFGGAGTDTFRGGANADGFFFGPDKFGTTDVVHGGGGIDQLGLDGHSAALTLDSTHTDVEVLALLRGPTGNTPDTYGTITVDDSWVAAGQTKTITAVTAFQSSVGPVATSLVIDGSHETDGNLTIYGGSANDTLTGGAGADHLYGGLGADTLTGGGGADTFVYNAATESTSTGFDTLTDFTIGTDVLQISGQGSDSYAAIRGGTLSAGSFDADLQAAVGAQLSSGHAVFFTATAGDYANQTFLVVDGNGSAGYQAGGDFVFHVPAAPIATMGTADFITH